MLNIVVLLITSLHTLFVAHITFILNKFFTSYIKSDCQKIETSVTDELFKRDKYPEILMIIQFTYYTKFLLKTGLAEMIFKVHLFYTFDNSTPPSSYLSFCRS